MSLLEPEFLKTPLDKLAQIREELYQNLMSCSLCPNECRVNRTKGELGKCQASNALSLGSFAVHEGEEPPISGTSGSGTIFFTHCTLSCLYCQNYPLSQLHHGKIYSTAEVARIFLNLQKKGCHNLNLVSPTQFLPFALDALLLAREQGLSIPIVYNSSGWESEWVIDQLRYFVDIFLVDSRYSQNETAYSYSNAKHYVEINQKALFKMLSFQPQALFDGSILKKGVIIRVLILPGHAEEGIQVLKNLYTWFGNELYISLMSQYFPCWKACSHPILQRRITEEEYESVRVVLESLGFENGWVQEL